MYIIDRFITFYESYQVMDLWYLFREFYNNRLIFGYESAVTSNRNAFYRNGINSFLGFYIYTVYFIVSLRVSLGNMGNNELFEMSDNCQIGNKYLI